MTFTHDAGTINITAPDVIDPDTAAATFTFENGTFFWNGGVEAPCPGEERHLVPSPKVATYDLQPEMSAAQVAAARMPDVFAVSALTGAGLGDFLADVAVKLDSQRHETVLDVPYADRKRRAWLHQQGVVEQEDATDTGYQLRVLWSDRQEKRYRDL